MLTKYHNHFFLGNTEILLDKDTKASLARLADARDFDELCQNWQKFRKVLLPLWHRQSRIFAKADDVKIEIIAFRSGKAITYTLDK